MSLTPAEALIRARSALRTCLSDTAADLDLPARRRVLERRIAECTTAIAALDDAKEPSP